MEKIFEVGTLLFEDRNRISKAMADLRCFTSMLNKEIEKLVEAGYITTDDVTNEMVEELSRFEASSVIQIVKERYKNEANKISYTPSRNQFLKNLDMAIATIEDQVSKAKAQYEKFGDLLAKAKNIMLKEILNTSVRNQEVRGSQLKRQMLKLLKL